MSPWRVAVLVPARDEVQLIEPALASILAALDTAEVTAERRLVVVACDSCQDGTEEVARQVLGPAGLVIEGRWSSVGRARSAAGAAALRRLGRGGLDRCWLANTDADTTVPLDWVAQQLRLGDAGWAAALGIVRLGPGEGGAHDALGRVFAAAYQPGPGSHDHVHGANFGVSAEAYAAVGGWPPLDLAEDHALARRLTAAGFPVLATPRLVVETSARLVGRASGGFADVLNGMASCA